MEGERSQLCVCLFGGRQNERDMKGGERKKKGETKTRDKQGKREDGKLHRHE